MNGLKKDFTVVAMDQRGYNRSDQPEGVDAYDMQNLVSDGCRDPRYRRAACHRGWPRLGGAVAWQVAFNAPEVVKNW